jgi:acetylornithine/succinyldiaminopimelate/putrescine aminotransferase
VVRKENLVEKARERGNYFRARLEPLKKKFPFVKEIKNKGLMVGLELGFPGKDIVKRCRDRGLLINCTMEKILRFLPPLIIEERDIDEAVKILDTVFSRL